MHRIIFLVLLSCATVETPQIDPVAKTITLMQSCYAACDTEMLEFRTNGDGLDCICKKVPLRVGPRLAVDN